MAKHLAPVASPAGDPDWVPGSWLQSSPALTAPGTWQWDSGWELCVLSYFLTTTTMMMTMMILWKSKYEWSEIFRLSLVKWVGSELNNTASYKMKQWNNETMSPMKQMAKDTLHQLPSTPTWEHTRVWYGTFLQLPCDFQVLALTIHIQVSSGTAVGHEPRNVGSSGKGRKAPNPRFPPRATEGTQAPWHLISVYLRLILKSMIFRTLS